MKERNLLKNNGVQSLLASLACIDEDLKAQDQMAWVGAMNNIKSAALEILRESK